MIDKIVTKFFDIIDLIVSKWTSGQFLLTMAVALIILKAGWQDALAFVKDNKEIVTVIIYAYFTKDSKQVSDVEVPRKGKIDVKETITKVSTTSNVPIVEPPVVSQDSKSTG